MIRAAQYTASTLISRSLSPCRGLLIVVTAACQLACLRHSHPLTSIRPPSPAIDADSEEDDAVRRNALWFKRRHADGAMREKALQDKLRLQPLTVSTSGQWNPIGPQPIQSYGQIVSGRVWGIAVDPRNSKVVYVGTDAGGVWSTANGGVTWTSLTDGQANMNVRDLTLAPSAPDTIFAATYGGGILKSINDGATWTTLHPSSDYIFSIAVHPTNPAILLAADFTNINRSTDGGQTWTKILTGAGFPCGGYTCEAQAMFDPTNGDVAYAVLEDGLHRSTDGGATWSLTAGSGLPSGPFSWINGAIAPSATNVLYMALKGSNNLLLGFYRSVNSGASWVPIAAPSNDNVNYWGWSLRVHPTNSNVIYAGSLLLSVSLDGGTTWVDDSTNVHVDHHVQTFSADATVLYVGNDGGIFSTTTPAAANSTWTSLNSTLNTAMFYPGISISPTAPSVAFGGTQDNGILHYQGSLPWSKVACGDGGFTAIDSSQPQNVYAACQDIEVNASVDGGNTFHAAESGINQSDAVDFIPPLLIDPSNSSRLYFGTYRLYRSANQAASWTAISPDLTNASGGGLGTIAVAPSDPNTIYTGAWDGVIFVSRNALATSGATWAARNLPFGQDVTQLTIDPRNPLIVWATVTGPSYGGEGLVYRTSDGGSTWTSLSAGLPNLTVNDLLLDPDIANTVYVATDIGVYRSVDAGQSWLPLGTGLPNVITHALRLDRPSRTLRVGSYGRGMWDLSVPASGQVAITIASSTPGAYFSLDDGTTHVAPVSFFWTVGSQHTVTWLSGPPGVTGTRYLFSGWSDGISSNPRAIAVSSSSATYTGNLTVQYLLTVTLSPSAAGVVTSTPISADGYYNSGTSVQIGAEAAIGYGFWYLSGSLSGNVPQSIAMNGPESVTVNFYCQYSYSYLPSQFGSASTTGLFEIQTGSGCPWNLAPGASWLTIGSATSGAGPATVTYSVASNTGASRSTTLTITGAQSYNFAPSVAQDAASTGRPTVVSVLPGSGSGLTQAFTFQVQDPNGFSKLASVSFNFETKPYSSPACDLYLTLSSTQIAFLLNDAGNGYLAGIQFPSASTVQNSQCTLDASKTVLSGSGNVLTATVALRFKSSFSGPMNVTGSACDASNVCSVVEMVGTWTAVAGSSRCDVDQSGATTIADVGTILGQVLGTATAASDLNGDKAVNVLDVQIVINAAIGLGCAAH